MGTSWPSSRPSPVGPEAESPLASSTGGDGVPVAPGLAVVADDLTGAADTGVQFSQRGLRTVVLLDLAALSRSSGSDVVVLDTESRGLPAGPARDAVRTACARLRAIGVRRLYKKIDSTLRGHVGAEIRGALEGFGSALALVAPAFPENGRTVADGVVLVHGRPLAESPFAHDPVFPVTESRLVPLLAAPADSAVIHIPLSVIREGEERLRAAVIRVAGTGTRLVALDGVTPEDLRLIARVAASLDVPHILCGSAGLARAVVAQTAPGAGRPFATRCGAVLVISGSRHPASREQIEYARDRLGLSLSFLRPDDLVPDKDVPGSVLEVARDALVTGRDVVLALDPESPAGAATDPQALAAALGKAAVVLVGARPDLGLFLIGGDTAYRVLTGLGAEGIDLGDEVLPGIPRGRLLGGPGEGLPVASKAGGFGGPEAVLQTIRALRGTG